MRNTLIFWLTAVSISIFALEAAAQGSIVPRPNPSTPSPDGRDKRSTRNPLPDHGLYHYGREVYLVKLGCTECPLGEKPVNESYAKRYFTDDALRAGLSEDEEEAVSTYLRQLFGLFQY